MDTREQSTHVPQCFDGRFDLWLFRQSLYHQQNAVVHGNMHHKLEFLSNRSCRCGIRRLSSVPHTAPTLRSQVMLPMRMVQPRTITSIPWQELSRTPAHRSAWSRLRWTRDIFFKCDVLLAQHSGQGVCYFFSPSQGTVEVTTLCCRT